MRSPSVRQCSPDARLGPAVLADHGVLENSHGVEQSYGLKGSRHTQPGQRIRLESRDIVPVEDHRSFVRRVEAGDDVEEGGLPGTVGADHADDLARVGVEVDVVDGLNASEPLRHSGEFEEVAHCTPSVAAALKGPGSFVSFDGMEFHRPSFVRDQAFGRNTMMAMMMAP